MSLKKNDIGCHVGSHFCGAFGYADDIIKALHVPVRTHSVYLPLICECLPLNVQLELRVMKFL